MTAFCSFLGDKPDVYPQSNFDFVFASVNLIALKVLLKVSVLFPSSEVVIKITKLTQGLLISRLAGRFISTEIKIC